MKQLQRYGLAGIMALALFLRCLGLNTRGIQYDDAFSILLAERSLPDIVRGTAADTMPPLYYFILHFWLQVSLDLGWLRVLSIILSLGIIICLFLLVKQLFDHNAALWAAFFAAISPLQYYHAQDIRMYSLLALSQLAYAWFFIRIWKHSGRTNAWNWVGLVLTGTAGMYSHNLAIFFLIIPDVVLVLKRNWRLLAQILVAQVVIVLVALPWLLQVPGQVEKIQHAFWTPSPGLVEVVQAVVLATTNLPLAGIWFAAGLILSVELFVFILLETIRHKGDGNSRLFLLLLAFLPPVLLFGVSYLIRPVFVPRGFLTSTLAYLGLAGVIAARKWPKPVAVGIATSLVMAAAIGLPVQVSFQEFPRSPFQEAGAFLRDNLVANDVVIHDNKLSYLPMRYYWPDLPQKFLPDEPGSPNDTFALASQAAMGIYPESDLKSAIGQSKRVYFVVFQETIQEYKAAGQDHPQLVSLGKDLHQTALYSFQDLNIYQFEY